LNAPISLKPSRSETKSSIWAIDNALPEPSGANAFGAPSKKNSTGTCRIWDICCNLLAPMRLAPLSYFCTCWKGKAEGRSQLLRAQRKHWAAHPPPGADVLVGGAGGLLSRQW